LRPDRVAVIGSDLVVSALADDLGLSGVAKLEAMFDLDRSGQFGPMAKPVAGALGEDGRWTAKVPTAGMPSGAMSVLVRAVDRAGNASEPVRASVRLLSADEAAADAKAKNSAEITGVVMYGDQPQAGMKVSLAVDTGAPPPPKGEKKKKGDPKAALASATTDAQGRFKFPKVAPGKYVVTAEGLVRNNNRTAEQAVAFEKPQDVQPLTLKLK
jgi:Arc/MetJ-type ribon-helix-helix transcriptional regulator